MSCVYWPSIGSGANRSNGVTPLDILASSTELEDNMTVSTPASGWNHGVRYESGDLGYSFGSNSFLLPIQILNDLSNLMLTKSMQSEWCQTLDSNFGPTFPNGLPYYMAHIRLDMNFTWWEWMNFFF